MLLPCLSISAREKTLPKLEALINSKLLVLTLQALLWEINLWWGLRTWNSPGHLKLLQEIWLIFLTGKLVNHFPGFPGHVGTLKKRLVVYASVRLVHHRCNRLQPLPLMLLVLGCVRSDWYNFPWRVHCIFTWWQRTHISRKEIDACFLVAFPSIMESASVCQCYILYTHMTWS